MGGGGGLPYLEKIWFKMGEAMVDLQKIGWFECAYEGPFLNVSAATFRHYVEQENILCASLVDEVY